MMALFLVAVKISEIEEPVWRRHNEKFRLKSRKYLDMRDCQIKIERICPSAINLGVNCLSTFWGIRFLKGGRG
jgi:hypothetical protein